MQGRLTVTEGRGYPLVLDNSPPSIGKNELNPKQTSPLVNMYTI
jgi:hypothetical protein